MTYPQEFPIPRFDTYLTHFIVIKVVIIIAALPALGYVQCDYFYHTCHPEKGRVDRRRHQAFPYTFLTLFKRFLDAQPTFKVNVATIVTVSVSEDTLARDDDSTVWCLKHTRGGRYVSLPA